MELPNEDIKLKEDRTERSYFSAAVESMWGASSRSSTPKPTNTLGKETGLRNQHGGDHYTQHWHGISLKRYPSDCPPIDARWFYAVDVPKRKPELLNSAQEEGKPAPAPKKFVPFSLHDSTAVETAYQALVTAYDDSLKETCHISKASVEKQLASDTSERFTSIRCDQDGFGALTVRVPVHEDHLFEVDIKKRELSPIYWLGPTYEVRRGSWFYQEGSTLRACEENLASQLEEGYLKVTPFRYPRPIPRPVPGDAPKSSLVLSGVLNQNTAGSCEITPRTSLENLKAANNDTPHSSGNKDKITTGPQTHRLFGAYMNYVVTYQNSTVAWLSADSYISKLSSTVYQRFAGGGYLSGVKLIRGGFTDTKTKETEGIIPTTPLSAATPPALHLDEVQQKVLKRRSAPPNIPHSEVDVPGLDKAGIPRKGEEKKGEADERESHINFPNRENENQEREIDHLILVTHGIGQRLGMRTESVNFIHDVNVLRQTLKTVYDNLADLQALNSEIEDLPKNCRVQVLPICWRHLLDFPKKGVRQSRKEQDLGDTFGDEEDYPSLQDITPKGVPFVRSLISDLALDILLYQSGYRDHITRIVLAECNRIYNLFRVRNPEFKGKVSLVGHSLGSAIFFDILCRQKESSKPAESASQKRSHNVSTPSNDLEFHFEVEDFYCLGSPIGLFQMLKGRNILGRHSHDDARPAESPLDPDFMRDPFLSSRSKDYSINDRLSSTISSPKVRQLFNIFYPSDPISYRLEPLISPKMSSMEPQLLPYTKKTLSGSMSGIGAKVGPSVSGLWSSLSSGIASNILNRSLGLTNEDVARMESASHTKTASQSMGTSARLAGGRLMSAEAPLLSREKTREKGRQLAEATAPADRIGTGSDDDRIETLYAGFEKKGKVKRTRRSTKMWEIYRRTCTAKIPKSKL